MDPDLAQALDLAARSSGQSKSFIVENAVAAWLAQPAYTSQVLASSSQQMAATYNNAVTTTMDSYSETISRLSGD